MGFPTCFGPQRLYVVAEFGLWRSLVARPSGGRKVAGSSPASPTNIIAARIFLVTGGLIHLGDGHD